MPLTTLVLERVSPSRVSLKKKKEKKLQVLHPNRSRTSAHACMQACSHK
jgi:hypothetical protein|tara:strand:- start:145 stop:291 length:147 start_codon:yes stop_codon:yes gene_type:complete